MQAFIGQHLQDGVCGFSSCQPINDMDRANARLIAAAPDLLAACEAILEHGCGSYDLCSDGEACFYCGSRIRRIGHAEYKVDHREGCEFVAIQAAIANARGTTPAPASEPAPETTRS